MIVDGRRHLIEVLEELGVAAECTCLALATDGECLGEGLSINGILGTIAIDSLLAGRLLGIYHQYLELRLNFTCSLVLGIESSTLILTNKTD